MPSPIKEIKIGGKQGRAPVRIALAEGDPVWRRGLKQALDSERDFELVAKAPNGQTLLQLVRETAPDVLLMDWELPDFEGVSAVKEILAANPRTKVIVLTAPRQYRELAQAMKAGCSGVILQDAAPALLAMSIRTVQAGEIWLDPHIMSGALQQSARDARTTRQPEDESKTPASLTTRERQIVALVAQGCTNREIAEEIFLSDETIQKYLRVIFIKLNVSNRLELTLQVIQFGGLSSLDLPPAA